MYKMEYKIGNNLLGDICNMIPNNKSARVIFRKISNSDY